MANSEKTILLQVIQPGLLGLMDGAVSTLAPLFAAAFATHSSHIAFLVGLSAAVGAAISMAFAEALSDTGKQTGRGHPIRRGVITGIMTFIGGILHTLPFIISPVSSALTIAYLVVGLELLVIAYIRHRYFSLNIFISTVQVIVGGLLVAAAGILIGAA